MPVTTLNDLEKGVGINGTISGTHAARTHAVRALHDLVGERLANGQVIDAEISAHQRLDFNMGPLKQGETPEKRGKHMIERYLILEALGGGGISADMGDGALFHMAPVAPDLVAPPEIISGYAKSRTALYVTIGESDSLVGKRVESYLEPHYSGLSVQVCPKNFEGKWMVNALNGVAYTINVTFNSFTQRVGERKDVLIPLDMEHPNRVVFESEDFCSVQLRISWNAIGAVIGAAPTKDTVCKVVLPKSSSGTIDVHKALYDPDAVGSGGGREFAASMNEFKRAQSEECEEGGCSSDPLPRAQESAAEKRRKLVDAAEARMRA